MKNEGINRIGLIEKTQIPKGTISSDIQYLTENNYIEFVGTTHNGGHFTIEKQR